MTPFADRLAARVRATRAPLCVGIDPHLHRLPADMRARFEGREGRAGREATAMAVGDWAVQVLETVADVAAAVKPQVAFFEALGAPGVVALERLVHVARDLDLPVVLDAKRGDIGSTAEAYAVGALDDHGPLGADSITLAPYLGPESLQPFLARCDGEKGVWVLVRTSNPGAAVWQTELPVAERIAAWVDAESAKRAGACGLGPVGAVVAATVPAEAAAWRAAMPHCWFLVPGYGAQGGGAEDVRPLFREDGLGALINSSRGVLFGAGDDDDYAGAVRARAEAAAEELGRVAGLR
ncbi:MAG: orotidine-5'-phosphate decarboxylase [Deltaproteobacteria bacterium]|nr:MAG: orotidine-5'-phosphate decarboxylase [Deltaproteobacteria bacterium]